MGDIEQMTINLRTLITWALMTILILTIILTIPLYDFISQVRSNTNLIKSLQMADRPLVVNYYNAKSYPSQVVTASEIIEISEEK